MLGGRGSDEGRRRDVRRRRLGRGRRPGARGRPRRHRHPPRALPQPRVVPLGGARLLHPRGRERRAPGGRRDRHPLLRLGPLRALPRGCGRGLHGRVRRRPHAQPLPALQREDQVRRGPRPGAGARASTPSRPGTTPRYAAAADGTTELHRAVDAGKDQSYVLGRADPGSARALAVPARRHRRSRRCARRRPPAGCWSPTSPTPTTSASSPTATTPAGCARSSANGPPTTAARSSTASRATELGRHDGTFGFTIGQRKGLRLGTPAPDGKPRFVLDIEPVSGTVTVGPREALTVDRIAADRPRWCGAAPEAPLDGTVQLRAHGDRSTGHG